MEKKLGSDQGNKEKQHAKSSQFTEQKKNQKLLRLQLNVQHKNNKQI